MKKYEFKVLTYTGGGLEHELNILGKEGWSLVGSVGDNRGGPYVQFILQRELQEDSKRLVMGSIIESPTSITNCNSAITKFSSPHTEWSFRVCEVVIDGEQQPGKAFDISEGYLRFKPQLAYPHGTYRIEVLGRENNGTKLASFTVHFIIKQGESRRDFIGHHTTPPITYPNQ